MPFILWALIAKIPKNVIQSRRKCHVAATVFHLDLSIIHMFSFMWIWLRLKTFSYTAGRCDKRQTPNAKPETTVCGLPLSQSSLMIFSLRANETYFLEKGFPYLESECFGNSLFWLLGYTKPVSLTLDTQIETLKLGKVQRSHHWGPEINLKLQVNCVGK